MNTTILVIIIIKIVIIHEKDSFKFELKTWNIICNPYLCNFKIFNRKKNVEWIVWIVKSGCFICSNFKTPKKGLKGVCYTKSGGSGIVHICVAGKSTLGQHLSESTQCHLSPGCAYGGVRNIWRSAGPRQVYTLLPRWWHSAD